MARLLPLVLLVPATFAAQSSLDTIRPPIKKPTAEHQSQMKSLLTEAATHVRNGGPEEEKLHRMRELIELHNGFVTDMIAEYRPSLMARYAEKVARVSGLFEPAADGRRLATGSCFASYGEEWGCVLSSCWCDRALYDSESGPDISTGCDDSSEYSSYACDVSMLQTECKVDNDAACVGATQDDWVINVFTNGTSASIVANPEVIDAESKMATGSDEDDWNLGCGGSEGQTGALASSWSYMCCSRGDTCAYSDDTCSTDPYMCGVMNPNLWTHDSPSPSPTYASCAGVGLGDNWENSWQSAMQGATPQDFQSVFTGTTDACPNFNYAGCITTTTEDTTTTTEDCGLTTVSSSPRNAALALGSLLLVLAASLGLVA